MTIIIFDTLKYSRVLKEAGFTDNQAEGQAEALSEILEVNISDLVTKEDLKISLNPIYNQLSVIKWILSFLATGIMAIIAGIIVLIIKQ